MFTSFFRIIRFAWQNFFRNTWLSLMTVSILVLTLFLISAITVTQVLGDQALRSVQNRVDVSLFFMPDARLADVVSLQQVLEQRQDVKSVDYVSPDDALAKFRERNKDNAKLIATLDALGQNPFGPTLIIKAQSLDDYPAILSAVNSSPVQEKIQDKDEDFQTTQIVIGRLNSLTHSLRRFGFALGSILSVMSLLVVFNTIRIMIYSQREEIGIMKLVGASNTFVRGPFLIEAILYGIVATLITSAIFFPALTIVSPTLNRFFAGYDLNVGAFFQSHTLEVIGLQLLIAVGLTTISSSVAVGRYLRV